MTTTTRIAIIGAGHSGICMGMQLKRAGIHDFVILEKGPTLGGTWRDNTYPGASCDAPSYLYSFSFAQKADWSRRFAWQSELLAYSVECAVRSGLMPHIRFNAEVVAARFDETRSLWRVELAGGDVVEAQFLVTGVGQLHRPATPAIPGLDDLPRRAVPLGALGPRRGPRRQAHRGDRQRRERRAVRAADRPARRRSSRSSSARPTG